MLTRGARPQPEDRGDADGEIRDPLVLEFLGLRDEYSEDDLEEALVRHLESFLLVPSDCHDCARGGSPSVRSGWNAPAGAA